MSDYTPSEEGVRAAYVESHDNAFPTSRTMHSQEFDRFLADDRRKTAAKALREAADDFQRAWPVYGDTWLRERANAIEKGASNDDA